MNGFIQYSFRCGCIQGLQRGHPLKFCLCLILGPSGSTPHSEAKAAHVPITQQLLWKMDSA